MAGKKLKYVLCAQVSSSAPMKTLPRGPANSAKPSHLLVKPVPKNLFYIQKLGGPGDIMLTGRLGLRMPGPRS